jgi:GNAT superfamily N-acetyltransferase
MTTVRAGTVDDAEGVIAAHEEAWDASLAPLVGKRLSELVPFDARVEQFRRSFASPPADARLLVAENDGEIVGMAVCRADELRDIYVRPREWGSGVAAALLDAAVDALADLGATEAVLWVGEKNARARRFYEKHGWTADGTTRASELGPIEVRYRTSLRAAE